MAQASTIKDFLVALGFKTDNAGLAKMQGAMQGVELKAKSLNAALGALAVGAVLAVRQTASELDKLYFSSKRIGASAENINAYGNAIAQMGGSAEDAIGTLESLAEKMRNSPGYEGMLNSLGVSTKDANGALRDRVEVMKDLSTTLAKMPSYQANAYANSLGIDQKTLLAMRDDKFIGNMEKYQKIQKELGMNDELTKSGNDFMTQYRDLSMITKTGFQVIVMQVGKALIPVMKGLNQLVLMGVHAFSQMNPQIKNILVVGLRFALLSAVFSTVTRTLGLFLRLAAPLKGFIRLLGLLRLAFLATPIGIITALGAAILALYDDYKTWKEGGKSFLDWSQWSKEIDWASKKIQDFIDLLSQLTGKTLEFVQKIITDPKGALNDVKNSTVNAVQGLINMSRGTANVAVSGIKGAVSSISENRIAKLIETVGKKRVYQMEDGSIETRSNGTAAWRNNNPGNLKFGFKNSADKTVKTSRSREKALADAQKRYSGIVDLDQWGNAIFETSQAGANAKMQLLKQSFGNKTVPEMLKRYAVDDYSGKANHTNYQNTIFNNAEKNGINLRSKTINQMNPKELEMLAQGMVIAEGVKKGDISISRTPTKFIPKVNQIKNVAPPLGNPNKSQLNSSESSSQSNVTIHQSFKTDMTINGARSPEDSANAVKRQQDNLLAISGRNVQSIIR